MDEDTDRDIQRIISEGWAASGLAMQDLPVRDDPRMKGLVAIVRVSRREVHQELVRLRQLEIDITERVTELEKRLLRLEERVGVARTLQ